VLFLALRFGWYTCTCLLLESSNKGYKMISRLLRRLVVHPVCTSMYCVPLLLGCSSSPSAVPTLDVDPGSAATGAMAKYDKDGDGQLSEAELGSCPAILSALASIDRDKDGRVSGTELEDRIQFWMDSRTRMAAVTCIVTLDGRPLGGATVKIVPETFLADNVAPGSGVTMDNGMAMLRARDEDLPAAWQGLRGVQLGLYCVEITHPDKQVPAKFNTQTTLGLEINPATAAYPVKLDLKSN
jgi:hypothetical protein